MILNARSFYLIGKDSESHIKVNHYSCSRYHCVIQFLKKDNEVIPYILDLKSTNGTFINENKIESGKYIKLNNFDVINLGQSKTDFIIANSNYK